MELGVDSASGFSKMLVRRSDGSKKMSLFYPAAPTLGSSRTVPVELICVITRRQGKRIGWRLVPGDHIHEKVMSVIA
jgi:hypothetical protein